MASYLGRRKFLATLGGAAAAWPLAARAQQPALPVIGYLNYGSPTSENPSRLTGLRRGLNETSYVEGRNFVIDNRWAENQADRLPALAADPVQRRVSSRLGCFLFSRPRLRPPTFQSCSASASTLCS
jgi:hypothetical protein